MKVVVLGYGRVGAYMSEALFDHGLLYQVYNRSSKLFPNYKGVSFVTSYEEVARDGDMYLITVSDDAIGMVAENLVGRISDDAMVVHCAGAVSIDVLEPHHHIGSLYPLQTFSHGGDIELSGIPAYVTARNSDVEDKLLAIGAALFGTIRSIEESQKPWLHVAAVFANNFTNHILGLTEEICDSQDLIFEDLYPIIEQTWHQLSKGLSPRSVQTGPAQRGDEVTVEKHLHMLSSIDERWMKLYKSLSLSINDKLDI